MKLQLSTWIPQGSILLAVCTAGSYAMGLLRDRTLAQSFGASRTLDAYNAAFLVPDFLFNVLVAGGIAAAVVPIVHELIHRDEERLGAYINTVLTLSFAIMGVVSVLLILFAEQFAAIVAPGFSNAEQQDVAAMMRVLALSPLFFAVSNTLGSLLVAKQRYFWYGISPILYNAGIIAGAIVLAPSMGIMGVVYGTLFGAALHCVARIIDALIIGIRPGYAMHVRTQEFRDTMRLMGPKVIGHPVELATFWGFTAIASTLYDGAIVIMNLARNFQSVPVSLIGIVIGTSSFALLARTAARKDITAFTQQLKRILIVVLGLSSAATLVVFLCAYPAIAFFIGGGAFDSSRVAHVAELLGILAFAIPTEALSHIFARAWYATKNTWVPVLMSVAAFLISVGGAWMNVDTMGLAALGWWFVAGSAVKTIGMALFLPWRIARFSRQQ